MEQIAPIPAPKTRVHQQKKIINWTVTDGIPPLMCQCGHLHFGCQSSAYFLAPQWNFCDEQCGCTGLRITVNEAAS